MIFNSYVKLPEGILKRPRPDLLRRQQLWLHRARRSQRRRREVLRQLRLRRRDVLGLGHTMDSPWILMEYLRKHCYFMGF